MSTGSLLLSLSLSSMIIPPHSSVNFGKGVHTVNTNELVCALTFLWDCLA